MLHKLPALAGNGTRCSAACFLASPAVLCAHSVCSAYTAIDRRCSLKNATNAYFQRAKQVKYIYNYPQQSSYVGSHGVSSCSPCRDNLRWV